MQQVYCNFDYCMFNMFTRLTRNMWEMQGNEEKHGKIRGTMQNICQTHTEHTEHIGNVAGKIEQVC